MINLTIDGKKVSVKEGLTLLQAAEQMGIRIPTLCYHEAVAPYGACRVCLVEVIRKGWPKMVTACNYPVQDNIEVNTNNEKVIKIRKLVVELLLARCPEVKEIKDLAKELDIKEVRFKKKDEKCILCGLCVRVCEEMIGVTAIGSINRGTVKEVATPFSDNSDVCIGCGACVSICPTKAIKIEDVGDSRTFDKWNTKVKLRKCETCGKYFAPIPQLDSLKGKTSVTEDLFKICMDCRRKNLEANIINAKKL